MGLIVNLILVSQAVPILGRLDLNGTFLTVAVNRIFPYCDFPDELTSKSEVRPSFDFRNLEILEHKFNFQVKLLNMHNNLGSKINGTWDGLMGAVHNQQADIAMCDLSITYERSRDVDFTVYTMLDGIVMLSYAPGPKKPDWIVCIPFTETVWKLIGASLIVLSLVQYLNHLLLREPKSFLDLVLQHCALSTKQAIVFKEENSLVSKLSYLVWIVAILILTTGYISVLHSILTVTEYGEPLETQEQLLEALTSDKVIARIMDRTFLQVYTDSAQSGGSEVYFEIKKNIQRNKVGHIQHIRLMVEEIARWPRPTPPVIFSPENFSDMLKTAFGNYRELYASKGFISYSYLAMALRKKSPLLPYFNDVIQRMVEGGLVDHWMREIKADYLKQIKQDRVAFLERIFRIRLPELESQNKNIALRQNNNRELLLGDLKSIFVTFLVGLTLSFVVFVLEIFVVIIPFCSFNLKW